MIKSTHGAVSIAYEPFNLTNLRLASFCRNVHTIDVAFRTATPWPGGVELGRVVSELDAFAGTENNWSIRLRRPLVTVSDRDSTLLREYLAEHKPQPLAEVLEPYARWWRSNR